MVYVKAVPTRSIRFEDREIRIGRDGMMPTVIPVPDTEVVCNGCNQNIYPGTGFLVYLTKLDLKRDSPYDIYCEPCVSKYFKKSTKV